MVVTGRNGQIVRSLGERGAETGFEVAPLGRPDLDLSKDAESIIRAIREARPAIIVSAAAYTDVDKAEGEPEIAFAVNARGPEALARAAADLGVPMIHLSTDYVFNGSKAFAYTEEDETGPLGIYGASKLEAEAAVLASSPNSAVLRTAWLYSPFGANFVKTMLRLAKEHSEVSVVSDQLGNPTSALDVADGIIAVAENLIASAAPTLRGIFNMTAAGEASWAELAEAVFANSAEFGGPRAAVRHITTAEYPTAARRPANSRLDPSKLVRAHGVRLPDWRRSVKQVVKRLVQQGA